MLALQVVVFIGGTIDGAIAPSMTDVARGQTLIVNGTTVTLTLTPSQDDLAAASYYFLGGHEYEISDGPGRSPYRCWIRRVGVTPIV
jgi:hypothetical protein